MDDFDLFFTISIAFSVSLPIVYPVLHFTKQRYQTLFRSMQQDNFGEKVVPPDTHPPALLLLIVEDIHSRTGKVIDHVDRQRISDELLNHIIQIHCSSRSIYSEFSEDGFDAETVIKKMEKYSDYWDVSSFRDVMQRHSTAIPPNLSQEITKIRHQVEYVNTAKGLLLVSAILKEFRVISAIVLLTSLVNVIVWVYVVETTLTTGVVRPGENKLITVLVSISILFPFLVFILFISKWLGITRGFSAPYVSSCRK